MQVHNHDGNLSDCPQRPYKSPYPKYTYETPSFLRSKPKTPDVYAEHVVHGKDEDIVTITHTVGGVIRSDTYTRKKKQVDPFWDKLGTAVSLGFQLICIAAFLAFVIYVLVISNT